MLEQDSVRVLAENGKSFYLAGLFLNSEELSKISKLYHFCRYVDDCADKLNPPQAAQALDYVKKTIMEKELSSPFQSFVQALEENGVQRSDMLELVRGAESDTSQVLIKNDDELDHYCFQVAGVVGLMMLPLIGVTARSARHPAVQLGKAMQLTNICRDILEDAENGRIYLPEDQLQPYGLTLSHLQLRGATPDALKKIVSHYLDKADTLYEAGYRGLSFIPLRHRFAILLAGEIYRGIGHKIRARSYEVLQGRTTLTLPKKLAIIFLSLRKLVSPNFWFRPPRAVEVCGDLL